MHYNYNNDDDERLFAYGYKPNTVVRAILIKFDMLSDREL